MQGHVRTECHPQLVLFVREWEAVADQEWGKDLKKPENGVIISAQ